MATMAILRVWLTVGTLATSQPAFAGAPSGLNVGFVSVPVGGAPGGAVPCSYRVPAMPSYAKSFRILVLVPGYNGDGKAMIDAAWSEFADREGLVLVTPTFKTTKEEVHSGKGYYYPALWSGEVVLEAVRRIAESEKEKGIEIDTEKIFIFGFSAGAHFAHRFALWKPGRVGAFAAYSAAWWGEPTKEARSVPGLIMCGEADGRYEASREFMAKAQALGLPWIWRGYRHTEHEMTPDVLRMAQTFLMHYAQPPNSQPSTFNTQPPFIGDTQSYRFYPADSAEAALIPAEARVELPSPAVAKAWSEERGEL